MGRQNTFSLKPKNGQIVPVSVLYKRGTEQPETTLTGQYPGGPQSRQASFGSSILRAWDQFFDELRRFTGRTEDRTTFGTNR
jgi:hypothetical protein